MKADENDRFRLEAKHEDAGGTLDVRMGAIRAVDVISVRTFHVARHAPPPVRSACEDQAADRWNRSRRNAKHESSGEHVGQSGI